MSASNKRSFRNLEQITSGFSIPSMYLLQLLDMGLWYSPPIQSFAGGAWIYKPKSTPGNTIADYEPTGVVWILFDEGEETPPQMPQPESDAAKLALYYENQLCKWIVFGMDCAGGMGPGDFVDLWDSPEEAIADIKEFYFGDPARMNAKAAFHRDPIGEIERAMQEGRMPQWPLR